MDNLNKAVYQILDQTLHIISDNGLQSEFRDLFESKIDENNITSYYDPIRREFVVAKTDGSFAYTYNDALQKWVSNYEFDDGLKGGLYTNLNTYLFGRDQTGLSLHTMYTNNDISLFGVYQTPRVSFVVNPEAQFAKTFDGLLFVASNRLATADLLVEREVELSDQDVTGLDIDVNSRGLGNYKVKVLRDADGARLKGTSMKATVKWKAGSPTITTSLTSVLTQYRPIMKLF